MSLEGALGTISVTSNKNPRQAIKVDRELLAKEEPVVPTDRLSSRQILKAVEQVYSSVLSLEQQVRCPPKDEEENSEWNRQFEEGVEALWQSLQCSSRVSLTYFYITNLQAHPCLAHSIRRPAS